jgi:hypothetical protein
MSGNPDMMSEGRREWERWEDGLDFNFIYGLALA